jgi:ABC-type branched-subunit amino acid transport system permease subunit
MTWNNVLLFALLGLGSGALIAGLAIGVVLQYRGSGTIDISLGAMAMLGGYIFYALRTSGKLFVPIPFVPLIRLSSPWSLWPALLLTAVICAALGVAVSMGVFARLRTASPVARLVVTLGFFILLQAMVVQNFGTNGQGGVPVLPETTIKILGTQFPWNRLVMAGIVAGTGIALWAIYKYSRFGLATRAAAENEASATLIGLSPNPLAMVNTVTAYVLAGLLGVMVASVVSLDPTILAISIIPALGAALLAQFTSFGIAVTAGFAMGIIQSELVYFQAQTWFPTPGGNPLTGVADLVFLVVIIVALVWRGSGLPQRGAIVEHRLPPAPRPKRILRPTLILAGLSVLGLIFLPYDYRQALINTLIAAVICLSFTVITGYVGQISLLQTALAGVAGFTLARVAIKLNIGFPLGALMGLAAAVVIGLLTAAPALRIRGVNLVIVSLAAAVAIERFGFDNNTWGDTGNQSIVPAPKLFGFNFGPRGSFPGWNGNIPSPTFGLVCLGVAVVVGLYVATLRRGLIGQKMLAVRSNERAAAAIGIDVANVKLRAFAIGSLIAGLGGVLYAYDYGAVSVENFSLGVALAFLAFAYMGGITTVAGAIFGATFVHESLPSHAVEKWTHYPLEYQFLIGGIGLIFIVLFVPNGVALAHSSGKAPHNYIFAAVKYPFARAYRALPARDAKAQVAAGQADAHEDTFR